jgi:hypothetical protein
MNMATIIGYSSLRIVTGIVSRCPASASVEGIRDQACMLNRTNEPESDDFRSDLPLRNDGVSQNYGRYWL